MKVKRSSGCNISYLFISIMIQTIIFSEVCGQSISVSGKITSNRYPIQNASVTFIDNSDTTNKISTLTDNAGIYQIVLVSSVELNSNSIPDKFELVQNYPNPFSTSTAIPYRINQQSEITITIYDILGRKVRSYPVGVQRAGNHNLIWDGRDDFGARVASGIYFYMIQSKGESRVKKMIFTGNGNNAVMIPNLQASTPYSCLNKANKTEGNVFTIRVGNTGATTPLVVPEEFERVAIQNGTTIDLSVAYIPLTFDFDSLHQVISGYGAASPWYLPVATDSEIENAFGTDDGQIGLSIYRITVEADSNLWSKWVPSTKNAQDMGAIIIASPWYAPGSLTEFRDGKTRIQLDKYTEYAAHLNAFVKFMERNGVSIYGLSVQNEPDAGDWTNWSPSEMFAFVKDYAGLIEGTLVMAPESFQFLRNMSDLILNDSVACANTDIVCGHIYGGGPSKYPLAEEKGKEV